MADPQACDDAGIQLEQIASLRATLDEINLQLLKLLESRGRVVHDIMAIKRTLGTPAHDPQREREMMRALLRHAADVYPSKVVERIFSEIFAASRALGQG